MDTPTPTPVRRKPPQHLTHCAEADGLMTVGGPCHRAVLDELQARERRRAEALARAETAAKARKAWVETEPAGPTAAPAKPFRPTPRQLFKGLKGLTKALLNLEPVDEASLDFRRSRCEKGGPDGGRCVHLKLLKPEVAGVALPLEYMGCEACKCAYQKKIRNAGESCPIGLWGPVEK